MDYLSHILVMVCIYAILATSLNLLIGFAGLFALAHAAFYAFGAYTTAILSIDLGLPFPIPMLLGALLTAAVGSLVAFPAIRIGGIYLVIITLALQVIVLAVIRNWKSLTGGPAGISGIPQIDIFGLTLNSPQRFLPLAAIVAAICFCISWRLAASPFGRALKAMREEELAAQAVGKDVIHMKVVALAFSAGLASVAGSLIARYITFVGVDSFSVDETIFILAMVILGGTANLWGSLIGTAILVILPELLKFINMAPDVADKLRQVIYGFMLIAILRVRPQGILPERDHAPRLPKLPAATPMMESGRALTGVPRSASPIVTGSDLSKSFGGITAVRGFDVDLLHGSITGLIGPNGAGKTTAFNLVTGFLKPDAGEIRLRGTPVTGLKPHRIVHAGMARSFQDLKLFRRMTVLENVLVSLPNQLGDRIANVFFRPVSVWQDERANIARAVEVLRFIGLEDRALTRAENLSYAEEKLLVIARLLATGAEVLLFDEPLSGLDPSTLAEIFPLIRRLAQNGKTICIIEHNLDVIKGLCDRVFFLDEGHTLAVGSPDEVITDPALAKRYFR